MDLLIDMAGVDLRRDGKKILDGVCWRVNRGEQWVVIGANGSGKTTLLQIAAGILFPTAGRVTVLGGRFGATDLFTLRRRIGWVSSALLSRLPPWETAREIVVSGRQASFGLVQAYSARDVELAEKAMARVGLADCAHTPFGKLSQGEQQKTLFARSVVAEPELFILDEVCSGLDLPARESFLKSVEMVVMTGQSGVIMVTHHIEEIPPVMTHALILRSGSVLASGPIRETIVSTTLSEVFGIQVDVESRNGRFWAKTP